MPKAKSQKQRIIEAIENDERGYVTNVDLNEICFRYSARIKDINDDDRYPFIIRSKRLSGAVWQYYTAPRPRPASQQPEGELAPTRQLMEADAVCAWCDKHAVAVVSVSSDRYVSTGGRKRLASRAHWLPACDDHKARELVTPAEDKPEPVQQTNIFDLEEAA